MILISAVVLFTTCRKTVLLEKGNNPVNFYGGPGDYNISSMIHTADDGYALFATIENSAILIKYDANHQKQWVKNYRMYRVSGLLQTSDGGYMFQGTSSDSGNILVSRTDRAGNITWSGTYNDSNLTLLPFSLCTDNAGNCYSSGYGIMGTPSTNFTMYICKITPNGNIAWYKKYINPSPLYPYYATSMIICSDGSLIAATLGGGAENIMKLDTGGNTIGFRILNYVTNKNTFLYGMTLQQKADGSYSVLFDETSNSSNSGSITWPDYYHQFYAVNVSQDFKQRTVTILDSVYNKNVNTTLLSSGSNMLIPFVTEPDGSICEAIPNTAYNGYSQQEGQFEFTRKNAQGKPITSKLIPGWPMGMIMDQKGNYFICGLTMNLNSDNRGVFSIYLDKNGNVVP